MAIWKSKTVATRGHDPDVKFFPIEKGVKEFFLFGIKVYEKEYDSSTTEFIISEENKTTKGMGFKK